MKNRITSLLTLVIVSLTLSSNAFSQVMEPEPIELRSTSGLITVTEVEHFLVLEYALTIAPDSDLVVEAFAISTGAEATGDFGIFSSRQNWRGFQLSMDNWDENTGTSSEYAFLAGLTGQYSTLFGDDPFVNLFYLRPEADESFAITTESDGEFQFFQDFGLALSDFVAFNGAGAIVGQSIAPSASAQVPEPSTLMVFALGIFGLVVRRFKKA